MTTRAPVTGPTTRLRSGPRRKANISPALAAISVTLLIITALAILRIRSGRSSFPATVEAPLLLEATSPAVGCPTAEVERVRQLLAQAQWERAEVAAQQAQKVLCSETARTLGELQRAAGIEVLLATPADPSDLTAQAALAARYQHLRQGAADAPPGLTDLQIARRAYDAQLFTVARAAFEAAWQHGAFSRGDRALVQEYASTLYNLAYWRLEGPEPLHYEALRLLAASFCIEHVAGLSWAASVDLLQRRAGVDSARWPTAASTPVLHGVQCPAS